jgi:subtilisin family serine protease
MDPALWELLEEGHPDEEVAAVLRLRSPDAAPRGARIVTRFGEVATCRLKRSDILDVRADESVESMKGPRLFTPDEYFDTPGFADFGEAVRETDVRRPPDESAEGRGVVVGVIDWGVDFAHPDFLNDDGTTRLLAVWDQRARPAVAASNPYGYGEIFHPETLNRALARSDPYAALGYHPADADLDRSGTHGTHVLSIAAGNGRAGGPQGVAPSADLVFVHLSMWGREDPNRLSDSVTIIEAIDFIARTAGPRSWVVNMSLGRHAGPHDGTTLVEQALDAAVMAAPGRAVVQSAGNYFDRRAHASGQLRPGESRTLLWKTDEADITPNEMDIWYPGQDHISVEVRAPDGSRSRRVELDERDSLVIGGREVCKIYNRAGDPNNRHNHIDIFLYPGGPAGDWDVLLTGEDIVDGRFHAWIERDAACRGCQSHFEPSDAVTSTTTGTICNGFRTIAVGAYNAHAPEFEMAPYSSGGPTRDGRIKPDLVAPGVRILAARSRPRPHHPEDSLLTRKSGTSMAAPHVTGTVALMHEVARRPLWIKETRRLLLTGTRSVPASPEFVVRAGSGVLDTARAIELTRRFFEERGQTQNVRPRAGASEVAARNVETKSLTETPAEAVLVESFAACPADLIGAAAAEALLGVAELLPGYGRCEFIRRGDMIAAASLTSASSVETEDSNEIHGANTMLTERDDERARCSCKQPKDDATEADFADEDSTEAVYGAEGEAEAEDEEATGAESVYFTPDEASANDYKTDAPSYFENSTFESYAPDFVEMADAVITAGGRAVSASRLLSEVLDSSGGASSLSPLGSGRALSPAVIFDAFTHGGSPALRRHLEEVFEIIAAPCERFAEELRAGDLLVRRGEAGLGHLALVASPQLLSNEQLSAAGLRAESVRKGLYAQVVEGGAFPHARADGFARLVADESGRVPHNQMVLRLRRVPPATVGWEGGEYETGEQQYAPRIFAEADIPARLERVMPKPTQTVQGEVRDRPGLTVVNDKDELIAEGEYVFHQGGLIERGKFEDKNGRAYFGKIDPARPFVFEVRDRVCAIRAGAFFDPDDPNIEYGGTWFDWTLVRDDRQPDANFWPHYQQEMDFAARLESNETTLGRRVERFLQHEHITRRPIQVAKPFLAQLSRVRIRATPARIRVGPLVRYTDNKRAVIWLETVTPCMVRVRYKKAGNVVDLDKPRFASTVRVGGHHFAAVEIDDLEENKFYVYTVALAPLPGSGQIPIAQEDFRDAFPKLSAAVVESIKQQLAQTSLNGDEWPTFRTLRSKYTRLRFATGSCRMFPGDLEEGKDRGPDMLDCFGDWLLRNSKDKDIWPHFSLFSGDQIYSDEVGDDHCQMLRVGRFAARVPGPTDPSASARDKLIDGAWAGRFAHRYKAYKDPDKKLFERVTKDIKQLKDTFKRYPEIENMYLRFPLTDNKDGRVLVYQLKSALAWRLGGKVSNEKTHAQVLDLLKTVDKLNLASGSFRAFLPQWKTSSTSPVVKRNPMGHAYLSHNFLLWEIPNFEEFLPTIVDATNLAIMQPNSRGHLPAAGGKHAADFAEYAYFYERAWTTTRNVRVALAQIPTFLIFDDHEITDDWNFDMSWVRMLHNQKDALLMWPKTLTDGLAAYWVYQGWGNKPPSEWDGNDPRVKALDDARKQGLDALPKLRECIHRACFTPLPPPKPPNSEDQPDIRKKPNVFYRAGMGLNWHYKLPFDPPFIVADCRSRKRLASADEDLRSIDHDDPSKTPLSQTIDDEQLKWMRQILLDKQLLLDKQRAGTAAFIVTSTPLLMQKKVMSIMQKPELAAPAWADEELPSIIAAVTGATWLTSASDALLRVFRRKKDLEHMIRDKSWRDLWGMVEDMRQSGSPVKSLVLLSGDVHHNYCMTANLPGGGRPTPELVQITSSGLKTPERIDTLRKFAESRSQHPFNVGKYRLVPGFMTSAATGDPELILYENTVALVVADMEREVNMSVTYLAGNTGKEEHYYRYTSDASYMRGGIPAVLAVHERKSESESWQREDANELGVREAAEVVYDGPSSGIPAPSFVELADAAVAASVGAAHAGAVLGEMLDVSALDPLGSGVFVSPAAIFDAFAHGGSPALRRQFEPVFDVLAVPGGYLGEQLRPGDLLLRRGERGLGHLAMVAAPGLWPHGQLLSVGLRPEGARAGLYAQVVEGGAFPHTTSDRFARLVAETSGRVPNYQMVLRPRQSLVAQSRSLRPAHETQTHMTYSTHEELPASAWVETPPAPPVIPPLTPVVATPSSLKLVPHSHVRRICTDGKTFSDDASATTMSPPTMNPGFLRADGEIDVDPALQEKLKRLLIDTPEYAVMLTKGSITSETPSSDDKIRVALVDLTGDKICKPRYAGWASTSPLYSASTVKFGVLYAAHQLLFDLNEMARVASIGTAKALIEKAKKIWSSLICKPDLDWLVKFDESASPVKANASDNLNEHLEKMIKAPGKDFSASTLILRIGFEYIASLIWQSGLHHPRRKGLWIGNTFQAAPDLKEPDWKPDERCHSGSKPTFWARNPFGTNSLTALAAATFFTLLAQRRLVNKTTSDEMETLLKRGCFLSSIPGVTVRATKCGYLKHVSNHDAALIEGPGRLYVLAVLTTDPYFKPPPPALPNAEPVEWPARDRFFNDLDKLIKDNNP